jgi:hypothetical protein
MAIFGNPLPPPQDVNPTGANPFGGASNPPPAQPPVQGGGGNTYDPKVGGGGSNPFMPPAAPPLPSGRVPNPYAATPNTNLGKIQYPVTGAPDYGYPVPPTPTPNPVPNNTGPMMGTTPVSNPAPNNTGPLYAGPGGVAAGGPQTGIGMAPTTPPMNSMIDPKKLEQAKGMRPDLPWNQLGPMLQHWTSMPPIQPIAGPTPQIVPPGTPQIVPPYGSAPGPNISPYPAGPGGGVNAGPSGSATTPMPAPQPGRVPSPYTPPAAPPAPYNPGPTPYTPPAFQQPPTYSTPAPTSPTTYTPRGNS